MGDAKRNEMSARATALAKSAHCIFCGGSTPATTADHCPPRALFVKRKWPAGYVFPACTSCNSGSRDAENWVALLSRFDISDRHKGAEEKDEAHKLIRRFAIRHPETMNSMSMLSSPVKRRIAKTMNMLPGSGQTYADLPILKLPAIADKSVRAVGTKLAKALHFQHTGMIVPSDATVWCKWYTNANDQAGTIPKEIFSLPTNVPTLARGKVDLSDQFNYRYVAANSGDLGLYTAWVRYSFCMVMIVAFDPGVFDRVMAYLDAKERDQS